MAKTLGITAMLLALALMVALGGCVQVGGKEPLLRIEGDGHTNPPPEVGNIPPGPQHEACRQEMRNAMARIHELSKDLRDAEKDLAECKRKREEDQRDWEREKDKLKDERDQYKKRLDRLRD